jgi:hypothetical protein
VKSQQDPAGADGGEFSRDPAAADQDATLTSLTATVDVLAKLRVTLERLAARKNIPPGDKTA